MYTIFLFICRPIKYLLFDHNVIVHLFFFCNLPILNRMHFYLNEMLTSKCQDTDIPSKENINFEIKN